MLRRLSSVPANSGKVTQSTNTPPATAPRTKLPSAASSRYHDIIDCPPCVQRALCGTMTTISTRDAATGIRFTVERFESVMPELPPLFYEHWVEVAVDKDRIALDPDFNRYIALDRAGVLAMQTVRRDGQLKGYFISEVFPHLHYQRTLMAIQDIY